MKYLSFNCLSVNSLNLIFSVVVSLTVAALFLEPLEAVASVGWRVDCANFCNFSEFQHNCQGVYWDYGNGNDDRGYSGWDSAYGACKETQTYTGTTHIIYLSQIQCGCPSTSATPPANVTAALTATTRAELELLRAQVRAYTPCAPDPARTVADPFAPFKFDEVKSCQVLRKTRQRGAFIQIEHCSPGLQTGDTECTYHGDQLANTPMTCLFGETDRCTDIRDSQDPVTGAWYRNPYQRRHPETATGQPIFSRDALLGIEAYVLKYRDKPAFLRWLTFMRNNPRVQPGNFFSHCPARLTIPKPPQVSQANWDAVIPDQRCALIPSAMGDLYLLAREIGITDAEINTIGSDLLGQMTLGANLVDQTAYLSALNVPTHGTGAYEAGDLMDEIGIRTQFSGGAGSVMTSAAQMINDRGGRINPGYHFIANQAQATEYGAYLIKKYCKAPRPNWGMWFLNGWNWDNNPTNYWSAGKSHLYTNYQFSGGLTPYGEVPLVTGHDCLTWLDMYLGNGDLKELYCPSGQTLVNGACRVQAFTAPVLGWIPGSDYKIRKSDAKITYLAQNWRECPYGGIREPNAWPWLCSLPSGLTPAQLQANVNYWVDPTPEWAGIYYANINGGCPYGGNGHPNCQLIGYPRPTLFPNVRYWVDPNPSWAGVYYRQISGACPYGGSVSGTGNCQLMSLSGLDSSKAYFTRSSPGAQGVYTNPETTPERIVKWMPSHWKEILFNNGRAALPPKSDPGSAPVSGKADLLESTKLKVRIELPKAISGKIIRRPKSKSKSDSMSDLDTGSGLQMKKADKRSVR
ncbi:MAG: hypothetical protein H7222_08000 [Methylotenera sp.]|nr:hypothetical protein [Oligoflexia bacterium]